VYRFSSFHAVHPFLALQKAKVLITVKAVKFPGFPLVMIMRSRQSAIGKMVGSQQSAVGIYLLFVGYVYRLNFSCL